MRPVRFLYLCIKVSVKLLTQSTIFLDPELPIKKRGALSKIIKNHIFSFFTMRPVIFLYLYIKLCILPTHKVLNFSFFEMYIAKKEVHFQKLYKTTYFHFYSAPSQISLYLHQSLFFTYLHSLQCFFFLRYQIKK